MPDKVSPIFVFQCHNRNFQYGGENRKFCSLFKIAPRFELCFAAIQAARTCPLHVAVSAHFFF